MPINYMDEGKRIDKDLRELGVKRVAKSEIVVKYNLNTNNRTAIWSALKSLGWTVEYNFLSLKE